MAIVGRLEENVHRSYSTCTNVGMLCLELTGVNNTTPALVSDFFRENTVGEAPTVNIL
jgi:predicted transcriptional regulator